MGIKFVPRTLGGRIKQLREDKEWFQSDLAKASGVDQAKISRIENNTFLNPKIEDLEALARALDTNVEYLRQTGDYHLTEELKTFVSQKDAIPFLEKALKEYMIWKLKKEASDLEAGTN